MKWAARSESRTGRDSLIKLAASHVALAVTADDWDSQPGLLGVANGMIDLERGTRGSMLVDSTVARGITSRSRAAGACRSVRTASIC